MEMRRRAMRNWYAGKQSSKTPATNANGCDLN
jgi:hypothetical protein